MALPYFENVPPTNKYARLYEFLWPSHASPPMDSSGPAVPLRLARCIERRRADLSIWADIQDINADGTDVNVPPAPEISYINLAAHPAFCVHRVARSKARNLIVREEYIDFMAHEDGRGFLLTGQPGIGKSFGACYFLFHLLASGKSVFFMPDKERMFYFSETGVELCTELPKALDHDSFEAALERSWVVIDVDFAEDWRPGTWVENAFRFVWTASPIKHRRHQFMVQLGAASWFMRPWSLEEIAALTQLEHRDPADILTKLALCVPVARSLLSANFDVTDQDIDRNIATDLRENPFGMGMDEEVNHQLYLVQPTTEWDEDGAPRLDRTRPSVTFLSNHIANRAALQMEKHLDHVRKGLADAFDYPTRSAAGKMVESVLHRELIRVGSYEMNRWPIVREPPFGIFWVAETLELLGKAEYFLLETHTREKRNARPLYLQPHTPNFAAIDSIIITKCSVWLVQSSLGATHSFSVPALLRICGRLQDVRIDVDSPPLELIYCLVGTDDRRVARHLSAAHAKLAALKASLDPKELAGLPQKVRARLSRLSVQAVVYDPVKITYRTVVHL
ncbi:hypothetical protein B0H11DRAFT_1966045 [Mycena galericulata]|nr:hypothetical protein B0H11DRAFT_1966045 [Mycena galericulata]